MRTNFTQRKNKLLALFLSVMMASSVGALAACTQTAGSSSSDSSSSSSTTTPKDDYVITNAGFETFDDNDGQNLIATSVTGWTRSVNSVSSGSALTSKTASGIIDTQTDAWQNLTQSKLGETQAADLTDAQAAEKWDEMSAKDKLDFYAAWEKREENKNNELEDLTFYQSFNLDSEDLPTCENPGTHDNSTEDTKVLMLHNHYDNSSYNTFGTAQKFTSASTVTLPAGTSAEFSVWVKTLDLKTTSSNGVSQDAVGKGAYISISNAVGSTSLDPLEVININTEAMDEADLQNGWANYTFVLEGAAFAESTFTIVLGLGQSGGTDRLGYVDGYAFFDDITCKKLETAEIPSDAVVKKLSDAKQDKVIDAYAAQPASRYVLDYKNIETSKTQLNVQTDFNWDVGATKEKIGDREYTAEQWLQPSVTNFDDTYDVRGLITAGDLKAKTDTYSQTVYQKYFQKETDDTQMLLLYSTSGLSYTAKATSSTLLTLEKESYAAISFFVKTSEMSNFTGAGIAVVDGTTKTYLAALDTTGIATIDVDGKEDIHNGWQQCFLFINNDTDATLTYSLEFTFGPVSVKDVTASSYKPGFAAFKDFQMYTLDEETAAYAMGGAYTKIVSLTGSEEETSGGTGFDEVAGVPAGAIEDGFAYPMFYRGVYSDDALVTGVGASNPNQSNTPGLEKGLLNKEYADNYTTILSNLAATTTGMSATWDGVFGNDTTQPLVMYNADAQSKAYGYVGPSSGLTTAGYNTLSMRVKTGGGAKAYIYLIDTNDELRDSSLTVSAKNTYWYDDNGNVCVSDPSKNSFNAKRDVAFKRQTNGLYKVNASWSGSEGLDTNAYYANLSAYTQTDGNNNKLVAKDGVSYNYTSNWQNDGNDGIAFYYNQANDTYYADSAKTIAVQDFAKVTALPTRTAAASEKNLEFLAIDTQGEWATVTFYIHMGDSIKNYRLEVWNGARDNSVQNPANSFVAFNANMPADLDDTSWNNLIDEIKDEVAAEDKIESVFSFYDSDKYLRYDATADKNGVGDAYTEYLSSAYSEGMAYLKHVASTQQGDLYRIFADYALTETTVSQDAAEEETEEETTDTGNETNVWLLGGSIAIAAVLLLAVVSLIIRKVVLKNRKKRSAPLIAKADKKKK